MEILFLYPALLNMLTFILMLSSYGYDAFYIQFKARRGETQYQLYFPLYQKAHVFLEILNFCCLIGQNHMTTFKVQENV